MVILNSSGKPQLVAALRAHLGASVIVCQEHHCRGADLIDLQHDALDLGWSLVGANAHRTAKDGLSAGVAIAARAGARLGKVGTSFDHSPTVALGRVTAAWVNVGPPSGIVVISVYLFHTEGMTARNREVLRSAFAVARNYGSP